jgi:hypothetical protein
MIFFTISQIKKNNHPFQSKTLFDAMYRSPFTISCFLGINHLTFSSEPESYFTRKAKIRLALFSDISR